jgi:hypothetical protein
MGEESLSDTNAMYVLCCKKFCGAKEKNKKEKNYDEKKRKVRKLGRIK